MTWEEYGQLGDILQGVGSVGTVAALIVGAAWFRYQKAHLARPVDRASAQVVGFTADGDSILEVTITIENKGVVPFCVIGAWANIFPLDVEEIEIGTADDLKKYARNPLYRRIIDFEFLVSQSSDNILQFFVRVPAGSSHTVVKWYLNWNKNVLPNVIKRPWLQWGEVKKTDKTYLSEEEIEELPFGLNSDTLLFHLKS